MSRRRPVNSLLGVGVGLCAVVLLGGCLGDLIRSFINVSPGDAEPGFIDGGPGLYDGTTPERLTVNGTHPDHGSFLGGTEVVVTGSGYSKKTTVRIGGKVIADGGTTVLSPVAIRVTTPAGEVGPADVEVIEAGQTAVLPGGYSYDPIHLDPESGPVSGGTLVSVVAKGTTAFSAATTVTIGGQPLGELELISPSTLRGRTPPGAAGPADVKVAATTGQVTVREGFLYYASANPKSGGMGGGPLAGTLTVAVLNWLNRKPVPGAKVVVQKERELTLDKVTDGKGMVVFTDARLKGPISVTAATPGYETSTLVSFDARDVTIFLMPIPKPQPGPMPPGSVSPALKGFVMFGGPSGAGTPDWLLVPPPKPGQVKRCYVSYTWPAVDWGPQSYGGAPIDYTGKGETAWPFAMTARSGTMAVYAVAGLYTTATNDFEPYAMGVTRGVVVGPGQTKSVDVWVTTPLTAKVTVQLQGVPPQVGRHRVRLGVALGADGVMLRPDMERAGDGVPATLTIARLPSFASQGLVDATYTVEVQLDAAATSGLPTVHAIDRAVQPTAGTIVVGDFVGVPLQVQPAPGGFLQGNTLLWTQTGSPASIAVTTLRQPDDTPVWRVISKGDVTQVKLPDPATLGLPAWPSGPLVWTQWLAHIPGFSFDGYNYGYLGSTYWDRWSTAQFELLIP